MIKHLTRIKQIGFRQLLVIYGDDKWCNQQIQLIKSHYNGDWITIADQAISSTKIKTLLGSEYLHAIFDARDHFDAQALAILSGCLKAGSLLILRIPKWENWPQSIDLDSNRWYETAIATPNFIYYLQQKLMTNPSILVLAEDFPLSFYHYNDLQYLNWHTPVRITTDQQQILSKLTNNQADTGYYLLLAERGRGKSAVAGMLAAVKKSILTAPQQHSVTSVYQFADKKLEYFSPDHLLSLCKQSNNTFNQVEWLIVDEAAAIPLSILLQFVTYFPKILFTTTIHGYEGTAMGFIHKFKKALPYYQLLTLSSPIRWAKNDPLERFVADLFLLPTVTTEFTESTECIDESNSLSIDYITLNQNQLAYNNELLKQYYQLLSNAHYRTSIRDLRRILDAPDILLFAARQRTKIIAALVAIKEGGKSPEIAKQIWAGYRRPKGHLVAQSLVAHAGETDAVILTSIRINRIAVNQLYRRQGIATELIEQLKNRARQQQYDYLSASFSYDEDLLHFWQNCGFTLVHVSSSQETSSGNYSVMVMLPISKNAHRLCTQLNNKLQRNVYWLKQIINLDLPITDSEHFLLSAEDIHELNGFAYHRRPFEASYPAICRLFSYSYDDQSLTLRRYINNEQGKKELIGQLGLKGKKALMTNWRKEIRTILEKESLVLS